MILLRQVGDTVELSQSIFLHHLKCNHGLNPTKESVDWRASVPEECPVILPVLQKGRPGNFSLPSPVQTAVYRTELSLGIGVPSRMPPFHSDIFIRSQV